MKIQNIVIIVICALLLSMFFIPNNVSADTTPLPEYYIEVTDSNLTVNGENIRLNGTNDHTVFYLNLYYLHSGYTQYRYTNHLFDSTTGDYNGDTTTHLDSDNYTHFWHQYFWLLQNLGLNCVRLGPAQAGTPLDWCIDAYYNHNNNWDSIMIPMLEMAEANGVYIIFMLGGGSGGTTCIDQTQDEFDDWQQFVEDIITEYDDEVSIAYFDICNEPYNNAPYWSANGGYTAYLNWRTNVSSLAQTYVTNHLVCVDGTHNPSKGWTEDGYNDPFQSDTFDLIDEHLYFSAEDDYLIEDRVDWYSPFNRPIIWSECGINNKGEGYVYPYWWYWPWLDDISIEYNISTVWMTCYDMLGYPITSQTFNSIPDILYEEIEQEIPEPEDIPEVYVITSKRDMTYTIFFLACMIMAIGWAFSQLKGLI